MSNHTSKRKENLDRFVGKHFLYTYENGWKYEMYIRNANTIDYRAWFKKGLFWVTQTIATLPAF